MRRELYRAREEVFWKELDVMTDEACELDDKAVQWVLDVCKDNFSGDGRLPSAGDSWDALADSLSSRITSTVESSSTTSSASGCSSNVQRWEEEADPDTQRSWGGAPGGAPDECKNLETGDQGEVLESSPAKRTRSNSHAVSETSSSGQPADSSAGCSKDSESSESRDSDVISRKRTRVKSQNPYESNVITPKRVLRNTITEMGETAQDYLSLESSSGKPRRRRHLSFPNLSTKANEQRDKGGASTSEDDVASSYAMPRETRSRTPRAAKRLDVEEIGRGDQNSEKPEVDEKESRKENDPVRPENIVEKAERNATKLAGKRKRSKSATAMDDNTKNKQARLTDFLRRKSPSGKDITSSKSPRLRGSKRFGDSEESDPH